MSMGMMRLYHFTSQQFGRLDLEQRRIKIARIQELNDPYELMGADLSEPALRASFEVWRDRLAATRGIVCFSRRWSVPVMWSHYAERHHGVALGFDIAEAFTIPVTYVDERERRMREILKASDEEAMIRILGTKHRPWQYEDEVRLFCDLKNAEGRLFFQPFDSTVVLREVILGVRALDADVKTFKMLAARVDPAVPVFRAALSDDAFEVIRPA